MFENINIGFRVASANGANLLTNGAFEDGNTGFSTEYSFSPSNINPYQTYAVVNNPRSVHGDAASYGDHTTGLGLMMVVNAANTSDVVVWSETVSTETNKEYDLIAWISTWHLPAPVQLRFSINGISLGTVIAPNVVGEWLPSNFTWNSNNSTTATIEIVVDNPGGSSNDFALDDITFTPSTDVGDNLLGSTDLGTLTAGMTATRIEQIGNGQYGANDIDLYRFTLTEYGTVDLLAKTYEGPLPVPTTILDGYLRLFDSSGNEIASNDSYPTALGGGMVVRGSKIEKSLQPGTYYVGVSGDPNRSYRPYVLGDGDDGNSTGTYTLSVGFTSETLPPISGDIRTVAGIEIQGAFEASSGGWWTANGAILLNNTVEVIGRLQFNEATQIIEGDAAFWLRGLDVIGDVLIYDDVFRFDTHAITDDLKEAVSDFKVMGMDVSLDTLELVSGAIRIQGGLSLPTSVGTDGKNAWKLEITGNDYIEIGPDIPGGFRFSGATITVPDTKGLSFHGIPFKNEGVTIYVSSDEIQIRGRLELPQAMGGTTIDLLTNDRHIAISNHDGGLPELEIVGELRIDGPIGLDGGFSLEDLVFEIDTTTREFRADGRLNLPAGTGIDVGVGIKEGSFNYISMNYHFQSPGYPVIYGPPPAPVPIVYWQEVGARLDELAPGPPPFVIGGNMAFTAGPQIHVNGNDYYLVRLDLDAEYDTGGRFTGTGEVLLGGGENPYELASATVVMDKGYGLYVKGDLNYAGVLDVSAEMHLGLDRNLSGSFEGDLHAPSWLGGWSLATAKGYGQYLDDDNLDNDFLLIGGRVGVGFVSVKKAVEFNLNTGDIDWFASYSDLQEIVVQPPPTGGIIILSASAPHELTLPVGLDSALFKLEWDTGDTDIYLTDPSGTITYTPDNVGDHPGVWYYKDPDSNMAVFEVAIPAGGTWTLVVSETDGIGGYTVTSHESTIAPAITVQTPQIDRSVASVDITWLDEDSDSNATISLFYDTDRGGVDGMLIASGISEDDTTDSFTWDTADVPTGEYYVYAVIDDGVNVQVVSYSTGRVTVVDPDAPQAVTGLNAPEGTDTTVRLTWDASTAPDLDHYLVRLTGNAAGEQVERTVTAVESEAVIGELVMGESYRVVVAAVDTEGHIGQESDAILVVVGGAATVGPEPDQWAVFAQPGTLYSATVPGVEGDSFSLISGPPSATLDPVSGLFEWDVPVDTDWFEVLAHVTHADGTKSVERFQLLADAGGPLWTEGALQLTPVNDTTIEVLAPDGIDGTGVLQYQLERDGSVVGDWQTSPEFSDSGLSPNSSHEYRVQVKDASPGENVSEWTSVVMARTLAEMPAAPVLGGATQTTVLLVGLGIDGNPVGTEYALFDGETSMYVASDGSLTATPVWQTRDVWTNLTITGLEQETRYTFQSLARNGDGQATPAGPATTIWTAREAAPPVVSAFSVVDPRGIVTVDFSEAVTVSLEDLTLANEGGTLVDLSGAGFEYAAATNQATVDLRGYVRQGPFTLTLDGGRIQDTAGNLLDGDADGGAGGDYVQTFSAQPTDFDFSGNVDGADLGLWQTGFGTPTDANLIDGDADSDGDVDGFDFLAWQRGFIAPPTAAASAAIEPASVSSLGSETAALSAEPLSAQPLSAELVDAAIAMDQALRLRPESRFRPPARHREAPSGRVAQRARWDYLPAWHGTHEMANHLFHGQSGKAGDGRFHRDADAVDEALLDTLFAEEGLISLL